MSRIQPIATTRVTETITRGRLTAQIQADQLALFGLQNQLSTGRRFILPSEDPSSAQRASVLQRTLERQAQSLTNLRGARVSLANTESAINRIASGLNELRSSALGAIDSFSLPEERDNLIIQIDRLLDEFTRVGNANFATNFLLGGAERSTPPYAETGEGFVDYLGDESTSRTFIDIGLVFEQGVSGDEVLGGLSESFRGIADLDPAVRPDTRLSQINGGAGLTPNGALALSYTPSDINLPGQTVTVDLSTASTLGDVARLIEAAAPGAAGVAVSVSGNGLRVEASDGVVGIQEVAGGSAASELGFSNVATGPTVVGGDLDPTLSIDTRLDDLQGTRARGRIVAPGANNDLTLTANANGDEFNDLVVNYQAGATAGFETATFTPGVPPTLTVQIAEGESTARDIAAAINNEGTFTAETDPRDQLSIAERGLGTVTTVTADDLAVGVTGGSGITLDLASGLIITNGNEPFTPLDTSGFETVADLLSALNEPVFGLQASINERGDGLDIRTRRSGADFAIAENGGQLATQLGLRTFTGDSRLADFNRGQGVLVEGAGDSPETRLEDTRRQNVFEITIVEDGVEQTFTIDPVGLTTVDDLIQRISDDTGGAVAARLVSTGNGIELITTDPDVAAAQASVTFPLANDSAGTTSLTIEADAPGPNPTFTLNVTNTAGAGPATASLSGNAITVDLNGVPSTAANIASAIEGQLPGFTVTLDTDGTETVSTPQTPAASATIVGATDSTLATNARGGFTLNGNTISISSDQTGPDGNLPELSINLIDSGGTGPLSAELTGDVLTVDLAGLDSSTDAVAAAIQTALNDATSGSNPPQSFTVGSSGTAAVATTDANPPATAAAVTGGVLAAETPAEGGFVLNGNAISIVADQNGPDNDLPDLEITIVDNGPGTFSAALVGDTLTVDLAGLDRSTGDIAAEIQNALNAANPPQSYTVSSDGTANVATTDAGGPATATPVTVTVVDTPATGSFALAGETISILSDQSGAAGNLPALAIEFVDSGGDGPLSATVFGDTLTIDLAGQDSTTNAVATAIQDALNVASSGSNPPQSYTVTASADAPVAAAALFTPAAVTGGRAVDSITVSGSYAERLGFLEPGQESVTLEDTGDPDNPDAALASRDVNTREVDSVFTTLIRLREAVRANDEATFSTEIERLDTDLNRVTFGRAEVGVRLQTLDSVEQRLADEEVTLRDALSQEIDADLAEVISEFTSRQFALQASLQTAGQLLNLTILDFI